MSKSKTSVAKWIITIVSGGAVALNFPLYAVAVANDENVPTSTETVTEEITESTSTPEVTESGDPVGADNETVGENEVIAEDSTEPTESSQEETPSEEVDNPSQVTPENEEGDSDTQEVTSENSDIPEETVADDTVQEGNNPIDEDKKEDENSEGNIEDVVVNNIQIDTVEKVSTISESKVGVKKMGMRSNLLGATPDSSSTEDCVAKIGETCYSTLESAISAAGNGQTVTINQNVTVKSITIESGKNIVLDLKGNIIEAEENGSNSRHYYAIENKGVLTIKDSSNGGEIKARGISNEEGATMTIDSGIFTAVDGNGGAAVWNEGNLIVNGGTFKTTQVGSPSDQYGAGCLNNQGTAVVKNGNFESVNRRTYAIISTNDITVENAKVQGAHGGLAIDAGNAKIVSGTFESTEYYGLYVSNDGNGTPEKAQVMIEGGDFKGKTKCIFIGSDINTPVNSVIEIKNGTFHGALGVQENVSDGGGIKISGGIFSESVPQEYIQEGANIEITDAEAKIGNIEYKTFLDARNSVQDGETIIIQKDFDGLYYGTQGKNFTIDLNGHDVTLSLQIKEGNITITGQGTVTPKSNMFADIYGTDNGSSLIIGHGVLLKGGIWSFGKDYGNENGGKTGKINIDIFGKIHSSERGVSVNGIITDETNYPTINIKEGAEIIVTGETPGIYQAGYSIINVETGTKISGGETAIETRAGNLIINGGELNSTASTYQCNPNAGGSTSIGAALAIAQHTTKKAIKVEINGGTFKGPIALGICNPQHNNSPIPTIAIKGGKFIGNTNAIENSATYNETIIEEFIEGGTFSSEISETYIKTGNTSVKVENDSETPYHIGEKMTVTFNVNGGTMTPTVIDVIKNDFVLKPTDPTKSCYKFNGWYRDSSFKTVWNFDTDIVTTDTNLYAKWTYSCRSGGGGGSYRAPTNTNTGDLEEVILSGEVETVTKDEKSDSLDEAYTPTASDSANYDDEVIKAYQWAKKYGITTTNSMDEARLDDPMTRGEMAKILAQFYKSFYNTGAITEKAPANYPDVKMQNELKDYIELAYQHNIMGINPNGTPLALFRPHDTVVRSEFGTALSRIMFGTQYNEGGRTYYERHLEALKKNGTIKNTTPDMKELRKRAFVMLYRTQN